MRFFARCCLPTPASCLTATIQVGKLLGMIRVVDRLTTKHPNILRFASIYAISLLPWMKVSQASASGKFAHVTLAGFIAIVVWSAFVHTVFLVINYV